MTGRPVRAARGFALLLVIWALVLLSSLAAGFASTVRHEIRVAADLQAIARAEAAATAALHHAILALMADDPANRWRADGRVHPVDWQGGRITVRIGVEQGRIDLNQAPPEVLAGLFAEVLPDHDPVALADAVIDRRGDAPDPAAVHGDRDSDADLSAAPGTAGFGSVRELRQVEGFDHDMVERLAPYVSVHSQSPHIHAGSADLVTLLAVPGLSRSDVEAYVAQRERARTLDEALDTSRLRNGFRYLDTRMRDDLNGLYAVDIAVRLDDGYSHREHAVIRLSGPQPYTLVARETLPTGPDQEGPPR